MLVRKLRDRPEWLISAWAADAVEREVTVDIPMLGKVQVLARPCGSVYRAVAVDETAYEPPVPRLMLLDPDGMRPSANFAPPPAE